MHQIYNLKSYLQKSEAQDYFVEYKQGTKQTQLIDYSNKVLCLWIGLKNEINETWSIYHTA